jgi:hypothetical protein
MKRILFATLVFSVFLVFNSCDTPLKEYKPKNDDEKQIVALLQRFTDARNNEDVIGIQSTFHDNGEYIAGNGVEFTKSQIATSDPKWWTSYGKFGITDPDIKINNNEAQVSMNTWFGKARFQAAYNLIKEDGKWLIKTVRQ